MWAREQINERYQNGCHLKTISQNNQKSNQHIEGINVNVHTKCEVSMTVWAGEQIKEKHQKWLPFKNYKSESLNI